jgi:PAS domain-containing protein
MSLLPDDELRCLRAAVEAAADRILWVERTSLKVLDANPAACRMLS